MRQRIVVSGAAQSGRVSRSRQWRIWACACRPIPARAIAGHTLSRMTRGSGLSRTRSRCSDHDAEILVPGQALRLGMGTASNLAGLARDGGLRRSPGRGRRGLLAQAATRLLRRVRGYPVRRARGGLLRHGRAAELALGQEVTTSSVELVKCTIVNPSHRGASSWSCGSLPRSSFCFSRPLLQ